MKSRLVVALLLTGMLALAAGAQQDSGVEPRPSMLASLPRQQSSSNAMPGAGLQQPSGSAEANTYAARMEAVLNTMTAELGEIAKAARDGKIGRAEAEYLSLERYYVALSRIQFLQTKYQKPAEENEGGQRVETNPAIQISGDTVIVPPRTSSPDIPPEIVTHLELNPAQIAAIEAQISDERKRVQPLLERLENSRRKLISLKLNGNFDANKVQALAAEQSWIMNQLIIANALLETKVYRMLTAEQQRKVDDLRRQSLNSIKPQFPEW